MADLDGTDRSVAPQPQLQGVWTRRSCLGGTGMRETRRDDDVATTDPSRERGW